MKYFVNIEPCIIESGKKFGLEPIATGGGCDFIWRGVGTPYESEGFTTYPAELVLADCDYMDCSPETLDARCFVAGYLADPEWQNAYVIEFETVTEAMKFMQSVKEPSDIANHDRVKKQF